MTRIDLYALQRALKSRQAEQENQNRGRAVLLVETNSGELDRIQGRQERDVAIGIFDRDAPLLREVSFVPPESECKVVLNDTVACVAVVPLHEVERRAIEQALIYTQGDRTAAAHLLGISRTTIYRKLKEYGYQSRAENAADSVD
jgi:DNA-binding NtrC family response regulator